MTNPQKIKAKQELLALCEQMILTRIETSGLAMKQAQESANSDDKSSAGDKYETGRAVGQRESEMHGINLKQHQSDLTFLRTIDPSIIHQSCGLGAAIVCADFLFFISLGLGATNHALGKVFLLSPQAPLAVSLKGKKAGDTFLMNGKPVQIREVF